MRVREAGDVGGLLEDLQAHGFARVLLRPACAAAAAQGLKLCEAFHKEGPSGAAPYDSTLEFGFSPTSQTTRKAFHAVKLANPSCMLRWPGAQFETQASELFRALDEEARFILGLIANGLRVDPGKLSALCDERELPCNEVSTSFMHLFEYQPHVEQREVCQPHTDSGLVTIIPRATQPGERGWCRRWTLLTVVSGLEVLDWSTGAFVPTEQDDDPSMCTVLLGETLARLTCHYLRATGDDTSDENCCQIFTRPTQFTEWCLGISRVVTRSPSSCGPQSMRQSTVWGWHHHFMMCHQLLSPLCASRTSLADVVGLLKTHTNSVFRFVALSILNQCVSSASRAARPGHAL
jgi:hypothetical protein